MRFLFLVTAILLLLGVESKTSQKLGDVCSVKQQLLDCGLLVCRDGRCGNCDKTTECQASFSRFECRDSTCVHKRLFPMNWQDVVATILVSLIVCLAAGSGIGGGSALVPIYVLVSGFSPIGAIPLSKATIFGGAISNLIINSQKRHPTADRPLIDYHTAALFVPTQLLGTMIGVLCNKIWPNWLITIFLIFFLAWLSHVTYQKAMDQYHKESDGLQTGIEKVPLLAEAPTPQKRSGINWSKPPGKLDLEQDAKPTDEEYLGGGGAAGDEGEIVGVIPRSELDRKRQSSNTSPELQKLYEDEKRVPWVKLIVLACMWVFVIIISLIKGGEGGSLAGIKCASTIYWVVFFIPFFVFAPILLYLAYERQKCHKLKVEHEFEFQPGDVKWNKSNTYILPAACVAVGFAAGALGIGGGAMTGPLMLTINMQPQVISATAAFMIIFTSSITSAQFIIYGVLEPTYAVWFCAFGFFATIVGQVGMTHLIKKYGRISYIAFSIAFILGISSILMGVQGILNSIRDYEDKLPMGFRNLCD